MSVSEILQIGELDVVLCHVSNGQDVDAIGTDRKQHAMRGLAAQAEGCLPDRKGELIVLAGERAPLRRISQPEYHCLDARQSTTCLLGGSMLRPPGIGFVEESLDARVENDRQLAHGSLIPNL